MEVIYGDTDSIMLNTSSREFGDVMELGQKVIRGREGLEENDGIEREKEGKRRGIRDQRRKRREGEGLKEGREDVFPPGC